MLLVGIRSLREADPGFARFQNGLLHAAPMPAFIDPNPVRPRNNAAPEYFKPANSGTIPAVPVEVSRAEKQLANLETLREAVHTTERGYRTGTVSGSNTTSSLRNADSYQAVNNTIAL